MVAKLIGTSFNSAAFVYGLLSLSESLASSVVIMTIQFFEAKRSDLTATATGVGNWTAEVNFLEECPASDERPFYNEVVHTKLKCFL